jgi:hypothetical protein|tara:strand:- start:185 stop:616 length:432 start_codon:yes stop_codon:yes gene_type:complete
MTNNKFYPVTIIKKDNLFTASIIELDITVKGKSYLEALETCLFEKDKIIKVLNEKKIPLPDIFENQVFKLFQTKIVKKLFLFTAKSIGSTLIFLITLLILFVMISPFVKSYLKSPYAAEHFSKISQKFGINMCIEKKCIKPND